MAEPLSVAASAIQVAGAGLKLAETLKTYIDSVRKAEKQLKPIADHVKLTSDVLTNVGSLLKNDEIRSLYTKELLASTNNALGGCRTAFEDLEKFISKMLKPNDVGKVSIQTTARFTFYFKQKELDILQAHLERFKSSLDLVLGVLNLASSARSAKDTSAIAEMKSDIQRLIQAEHDAKKKEAALVSIPQETDTSREIARDLSPQDRSSTARELPVFPAMNAMVHVGTGSRGIDGGPNQDSAPRDLPRPGSTPEATVLEYLKQCADAAARLTADIEKAIGKWDGSREYQPGCLVPAFQNTAIALDRLSNYEDKCASVTHPPPPYVEGTRLGHPDQRNVAVASNTIRAQSVERRDVRYRFVSLNEHDESLPDQRRQRYWTRTRDYRRTRERDSSPQPARRHEQYEIERYSRETEYFSSPTQAPGPGAEPVIVIRDGQRYSHRPITIREERRDPDSLVGTQRLEIKTLRDEEASKTDEAREKEERKRIIAGHEQRLREDSEDRKAEEKRLQEKIDRGKIEKQEKERIEWAEFLVKQKQKEEAEAAKKREEEAALGAEMRKRLPRFGYSQDQIDILIKDESHRKLTAESREVAKRYESPPAASEEHYFYEREEDYVRRTNETDRLKSRYRSRSRRRHTEIRPRPTVSNYDHDYSSDDSYEYVRRERTRSADVQDPYHKRYLAEGALAGAAAADILRHHRKSETEDSGGPFKSAVGGALVGGVGGEERSPAGSRSRSRSNSDDSRRDRRQRYRSHPRSRSRSKSITRKRLAGVAAVAALGARVTNKRKNNENDGKHYDLEYRNHRVSQAALASATTAGHWERARSKSRERSKSRVRQTIPVISAGLGGAALAGLWEKNKADKEAERIRVIEEQEGQARRKKRSDGTVTTTERSPTRDSRVYDPTAYAEYMQLPPSSPPPDTQPLTSATYIPDGESFGPGVKIPSLEAHDGTGKETEQVFGNETYMSSTSYGYPHAQSETAIGKESENEQAAVTSRGALVRKNREEWIVRRPGTPSPSPPRKFEKEEIIIRRKERSPSPVPEPPREPTPERLPPPPEPIYRPPIIQEVITHHRHIDHGIERTRSPTPLELQQEDPPRLVRVRRRATFDNASTRWAGFSFAAETSDDIDEGETEYMSVRPFRASRPHSPSLRARTIADTVFTASKRGEVFSLSGPEESMVSVQLDDEPAFFSSSARDEEDTLPLIESSRNQVAVSGGASTEDIVTVDELLGQWTTLKI